MSLIREFNNRYINVVNTEELLDAVGLKIPLSDENFKVKSVQGSISRFKASVICNITNEDEFIENYKKKTNEIKSNTKSPGKKSLYNKIQYFRCHHNTRHLNTMNPVEVVKKNPHKRFKNTDCPFGLILKYLKLPESDKNCLLEIEYCHNHPVNSLQALSFKDILFETSAEIKRLFDFGYTAGLAYREYWRLTKLKAINDVELHKMMSDRSLFPRRIDFNTLYTEYNRSKYGTQNTAAMFAKLKGIP